MARLLDRLLRPVAYGAYRLVRKRARSRLGVHAIALTPERRLILVKLRYAPGWRLPGGGREEHEDPCEAGLRELREEIGLAAHGEIRAELKGEVIVVTDVQYQAKRWSWEVQDIHEAPLDRLPLGLSPVSERWLNALRRSI
jgi:8-oxo-dGTP pyrophosphatase MutT (NUDIX family)